MTQLTQKFTFIFFFWGGGGGGDLNHRLIFNKKAFRVPDPPPSPGKEAPNSGDALGKAQGPRIALSKGSTSLGDSSPKDERRAGFRNVMLHLKKLHDGPSPEKTSFNTNHKIF
jgi:hypothetical protein